MAGILYVAFLFFFTLIAVDGVVGQFQYNPEWFQDEEDGDASDDWDLAKYRREQEEDNLAAEELRIANLALQSGYHEEGSGAGGE